MDYNIYIHSTDNSNNGSMTIPWGSATQQNSPTAAWVSPEEKDSGGSGESFKMKSPSQLLQMGTSALEKAIPEIAIAMAIVAVANKAFNTAEKVIDAALPFYVAETGNYYQNIVWENIKNTVNVIKDPFGTTYNILRARQTTRLENQRRTMQREILGDSMINTYSNRGV